MHYKVFTHMEECTADEVVRLMLSVTPSRREEALKFKHLAGKYNCLKSFEILQQLLHEHYGIPLDEDLRFDIGEHGKPSLHDHPHIHFNLSHCPHAIAVAVDDSPVGIDVERFIEPKPSLLRYTMNDSEVQEVESAEHPDEAFARLWTRKEALFKYYGTGIRDTLRHILVSIPPDVQLDTTVDTENRFALTLAHRRKHVEVVAAVIRQGKDTAGTQRLSPVRILATQRGYGPWKGWWKFPGGKPEKGETHEEALRREIREELDTDILIERFLETVEYDYPDFHLTMHCYLCTLPSDRYTLREHASARWLTTDELDSVQWLPADVQILPRVFHSNS